MTIRARLDRLERLRQARRSHEPPIDPRRLDELRAAVALLTAEEKVEAYRFLRARVERGVAP